MSNNIVSFKSGLDKKTLENIKFFVDILESQNHPDCTIFRMSIFPTYHKLDENQRATLEGIFVGMLYRLRDELKELKINANFKQSDFAELIEIAIVSLKEGCPFTLAIPFASSTPTIVFLPFTDKWVVTEMYVDHKSAVQRAFELYAQSVSIEVTEIFNVGENNG